MSTLLRRSLLALAMAAGMGFALWFIYGRAHTPRLRGPDPVASLEPVVLGGVEQWILIRGREREAPVLLFLHGGPGMPAMYLHHAFGRPLEEDFVVVHWDQRGAGKSFSPQLDPDALSVERVLADARELVDLLRRRFGPEPLVLVGHSWGSYLGAILAHRHPELLRAYVGVGQVAHPERARELTDRWLRATARERGRPEAVAELDEHGSAAHETWLFEFGAELHGETSFLPLVLTGLRAPEYSWGDVMQVAAGSSWSSAHMDWNALDGPLSETVLTFDVPVYFFLGRHDRVTPPALAVEYLDRLSAPAKGVVRFEESAHFPFFEQPEEFAEAIRRVLAQPVLTE